MISEVALLYRLLADDIKPSHYLQQALYRSYYKDVDPEIRPYLHDIELELGHPVSHFKIVFVQNVNAKNIHAVGSCNRLSRVIKVERDHWNLSTDLTREALLVHEIGHCYYDLDHNDEAMEGEDYCPKYLMHSHVISNKCYSKYRSYYIQQLKDS